jgi:hypothetical protein
VLILLRHPKAVLTNSLNSLMYPWYVIQLKSVSEYAPNPNFRKAPAR